MTVKAKFWVSNKSNHQTSISNPNHPAYRSTTVELMPVYGKGNEQWNDATPSGKIEMTITNEAAAEQFELGETYDITFEKAEPLTAE